MGGAVSVSSHPPLGPAPERPDASILSADVVVTLVHAATPPGFARHALRLAMAACALGDAAAIYLAVEGVTLLAPGIAEELATALAQARELGVSIYACPTSLAEQALDPPRSAYAPLGAAAALELLRRATTVITL